VGDEEFPERLCEKVGVELKIDVDPCRILKSNVKLDSVPAPLADSVKSYVKGISMPDGSPVPVTGPLDVNVRTVVGVPGFSLSTKVLPAADVR